MKRRILIIEDEEHLALGLKLNMELAGHEVEWAKNGQEGLDCYEKGNIDLIVVDLMMPVLNGNEVIRRIRIKDKQIPLMVLSAKDHVKEKVLALKDGVDDYLTKPFNLDELMLRIDRLLHRSFREKPSTPNEIVNFGGNTLNFALGMAKTVRGEFQLTSQEIKILRIFLENPGRPLSREMLLKEGWGYETGTSTRTLDNFIVRLRKYFEKNPKKPIFFRSVRSVGYMFGPSNKVKE